MYQTSGIYSRLRLIQIQQPNKGASITSVEISKGSSNASNEYLVKLTMLEHSSGTQHRLVFTHISSYQDWPPMSDLEPLLEAVRSHLRPPIVQAKEGFGALNHGLRLTRKKWELVILRTSEKLMEIRRKPFSMSANTL